MVTIWTGQGKYAELYGGRPGDVPRTRFLELNVEPLLQFLNVVGLKDFVWSQATGSPGLFCTMSIETRSFKMGMGCPATAIGTARGRRADDHRSVRTVSLL